MQEFVSIDQNCSPLWDVVPKLAALAARGFHGTHYVEDVDMAFSRRGADVDDKRLEITPECVYRGGTSDWGAALFYQQFLGRLPLDVRRFGDFTGMSSTALARKLGLSVDELYEQFSGSDNYQLIGASYYENERSRHRTIGDLSAAEIAPFMRDLTNRAATEMTEIFCDDAAKKRIAEWEKSELAIIEKEMVAGRLCDFYCARLRALTPAETRIDLTSRLFALGRCSVLLLNFFLRDYEQAASLYNAAVAECPVGVNALEIKRGEMPFFAIFSAGGRQWRESLFYANGELRGASKGWRVGHSVPETAMRNDGIIAISPKAILLVMEVRLHGAALALPEHGSLYMPASYCLQEKLAERLPPISRLAPVWRVRFNLLAQMEKTSARLRPPPYLREIFGDGDRSASDFFAAINAEKNTATDALEKLRDPQIRENFWAQIFPQEYAEIEQLEKQRRQFALSQTPQTPQKLSGDAESAAETRDAASELWRKIRGLDQNLWQKKIRVLTRWLQIENSDYCNWRGAILPWSIAIGGDDFYRRVIAETEIIPETGNG